MKEKSLLSKSAIEKIEEELSSYTIDLSEDITEDGILGMLETISKIQRYQERVDGLRGKAEWNQTALKNIVYKLKMEIEIEVNGLLINDEFVKKQSSKEMRIAAAYQNETVKELNESLIKFTSFFNNAKTLCKRINDKDSFLQGSYDKLSRQLKGVELGWQIGAVGKDEIDRIIGAICDAKSAIQFKENRR